MSAPTILPTILTGIKATGQRATTGTSSVRTRSQSDQILGNKNMPLDPIMQFSIALEYVHFRRDDQSRQSGHPLHVKSWVS